ncbi:hypothetical protein ABIE62_002788 [Porphyrobacter sp. MBR-155]|jgi:hypothetical protein|uniref:hypothetical protein n=1 Tax=Porphyrobacter sp. MBR-155 TaxID=3156464 RepID=UPI003394094A
MNWKTDLRAADLGNDVRLELTCKRCGAVRFLSPDVILAHHSGRHLYLDQVEVRARCKQRGCNGPMRMALVRKREASGFVGGIA